MQLADEPRVAVERLGGLAFADEQRRRVRVDAAQPLEQPRAVELVDTAVGEHDQVRAGEARRQPLGDGVEDAAFDLDRVAVRDRCRDRESARRFTAPAVAVVVAVGGGDLVAVPGDDGAHAGAERVGRAEAERAQPRDVGVMAWHVARPPGAAVDGDVGGKTGGADGFGEHVADAGLDAAGDVVGRATRATLGQEHERGRRHRGRR